MGYYLGKKVPTPIVHVKVASRDLGDYSWGSSNSTEYVWGKPDHSPLNRDEFCSPTYKANSETLLTETAMVLSYIRYSIHGTHCLRWDKGWIDNSRKKTTTTKKAEMGEDKTEQPRAWRL